MRAGEKKVTLTVNSDPVPFYMKVGDAGEAFFIVETDEDVPDELLTSPLLQPTEVSAHLAPPVGELRWGQSGTSSPMIQADLGPSI